MNPSDGLRGQLDYRIMVVIVIVKGRIMIAQLANDGMDMIVYVYKFSVV